MDVKVRSVGLIKMLLGDAELDVTLPEGTTVTGLLARLERREGGEVRSLRRPSPKSRAPTRLSASW